MNKQYLRGKGKVWQADEITHVRALRREQGSRKEASEGLVWLNEGKWKRGQEREHVLVRPPGVCPHTVVSLKGFLIQYS